jgi:hypothetical protein
VFDSRLAAGDREQKHSNASHFSHETAVGPSVKLGAQRAKSTHYGSLDAGHFQSS